MKGLALAFGLSSFVMFTACGDDSSSSSSPEENEGEELSLTGAVFGSDYKTGELRWIDKDGKISEKSLSFHQDSKVLVDGADLYVLERMGADNISLVAPEKLDSDGEKAVVWQVSLDDGANPVDMEFDGENGSGTANVTVDYDNLELELVGGKDALEQMDDVEDLETLSTYINVVAGISFSIDKNTDLSNGDEVTVTAEYDKETAESAHVVFGENLSKTFEVKGLK